MAIISIKNVGITALAACVPSRIIDNYHYDLDLWPEEEVRKVVDKVGVKERRFVDDKTCASDLCFAAADKPSGFPVTDSGLSYACHINPASIQAGFAKIYDGFRYTIGMLWFY